MYWKYGANRKIQQVDKVEENEPEKVNKLLITATLK